MFLVWPETSFVILSSVFNFRALMYNCEWPFLASQEGWGEKALPDDRYLILL